MSRHSSVQEFRPTKKKKDSYGTYSNWTGLGVPWAVTSASDGLFVNKRE